jgi:hypothetical protein
MCEERALNAYTKARHNDEIYICGLCAAEFFLMFFVKRYKRSKPIA